MIVIGILIIRKVERDEIPNQFPEISNRFCEIVTSIMLVPKRHIVRIFEDLFSLVKKFGSCCSL